MPNQKNIWQQGWTAEQPLLKQYAQIQRLIKHKNIVGNVATQNLIYGENGWVRGFFTEKSYKKMQEDGKKLLNPKIVNRQIKGIKKLIGDFWANIKELRHLSLGEDQVLSKGFLIKYKKFDKLVIKLFAYILTTWEAPSYYPELELKKEVQKYYQDWEDKYRTMITPVGEDLILKDKILWLGVLKRPTEQNIQKYMLKYPYLFANIDSEAEAIKVIKKRIKQDSIKNVLAEIQESKKRLLEIRNGQKQILSYTKSAKIKNLSYLLTQFIIWRLELKVAWQGIHFYLYPFYKKLAKAVNLSVKDVMMFWSLQDIINYLQKDIVLSRKEMKKRQDCYLLLYDNRKFVFLTGKEARKKKKELLNQPDQKKVKELKGSIANKGKVNGVVKLIKFDDLRLIIKTANSIKEKVVLVTGMTNPNAMPLIKKVKAIVTDEGGMTCHASIISREFNIPCIVGTKSATQVFKDGDRVEVDANKGVVRKM